VNVLLLWLVQQTQGYESPYWLTYRQAEEFGGHVRRGEHGYRVVYWNTRPVAKGLDDDGNEIIDDVPFLKEYVVFNAGQCEALPDRFKVEADHLPAPSFERIDRAWSFFRATGATIVEGGTRAFYRSSTDTVHIPGLPRFKSAEDHASTTAHELIHWSGAPNRSERRFGARFGDSDYAPEELVAELGAAFLCADLAVENTPREDHASYLHAWLEILKADKRAIFQAASAAEKAVAYLHSLQPSEASAFA
jgi:antirestriction protein ArdC